MSATSELLCNPLHNLLGKDFEIVVVVAILAPTTLFMAFQGRGMRRFDAPGAAGKNVRHIAHRLAVGHLNDVDAAFRFKTAFFLVAVLCDDGFGCASLGALLPDKVVVDGKTRLGSEAQGARAFAFDGKKADDIDLEVVVHRLGAHTGRAVGERGRSTKQTGAKDAVAFGIGEVTILTEFFEFFLNVFIGDAAARERTKEQIAGKHDPEAKGEQQIVFHDFRILLFVNS